MPRSQSVEENNIATSESGFANYINNHSYKDNAAIAYISQCFGRIVSSLQSIRILFKNSA